MHSSVMSDKKANRLINEKSPYLLQHAHNPVDWYPWGEEAFNKAKSEDKPIFLSIGYSTCHWCHVMERESFEDEEVSKILNENYVAIKVDREERPDIDSIYMSVCQAITGSGGWPLTVIMTPDKKPFFTGTYFPKYAKYGHPGIIELLKEIHAAWINNRDKLIRSSENIINSIKKYSIEEKGSLSKGVTDEAYEFFKQTFDNKYGGFGSAPKFPTPHNLSFLLMYYKATGKKPALEMATKTLERMYMGGIFDHIGFGFSRYSTDKKWLVPHFEKMLYDNALLSYTYVEAYQITKNELYKLIADRIFTYILRDMTSPEGGFYSAEDADSEGIEGKFYLWSKEELQEILGKEDSKTFSEYYDISSNGNFEGKNIPNLINAPEGEINDISKSQNLNKIREKLFLCREDRIHPYKDDKVLTSWNGLMIGALAYGGRCFGNNEYIKAAEEAIDFIFNNLIDKNGRLLARYRAGESAYPAYLDDYAFLIHGLIEMYEATYKSIYLEKALSLNNDMIKLFHDSENGGFFLYGNDSEELILKSKDVYDGAIPSGNSMAAINMLRLSRITGNSPLEDMADEIFNTFGGTVEKSPYAHTKFLSAFLLSTLPPKHIIIAGKNEDSTTKEMLNLINKAYMPFSTAILNVENEELYKFIPFVKNNIMLDGKTTAYVCENYTCNLPVSKVEDLEKLL